MVDFDPTTPGDSDVIADFPANERAERQKVEDWTEIDHYETDGKHRAARFKEQGVDPTVSVDEIAVYAKVAAGKANLYIKDEDGNVFQLTEGGVLVGPLHGAVQLANNAEEVSGLDTGATARNLAKVNASNEAELGDVNLAGTRVRVGNLANLLADNGTLTPKILTEKDEGAGNGLDADTVDGLEAANLLTFDASTPLYAEKNLGAYTGSGSGSTAHGLGGQPRFFAGFLVKNAVGGSDAGYSAGDEIPLGAGYQPESTNTVLTVWADSTNVGFAAGGSNRVFVGTKGGGVSIVTSGEWDVIVRCWK